MKNQKKQVQNSPNQNRKNVALISLSLIMLELVWTRIFSAEYYYTFAFLILSTSVCGLGVGAILLRLYPSLYKKDNTGLLLSLTALTIVFGPLIVFRLDLNFTELFSLLMFFKLFIAVLILGSAYIFGGMALSKIFRKNSDDLPRLYMFDLAGASIGVALVLLIMNLLGTQVAAALSAIPVLIACFDNKQKKIKYIPAILLILTIIAAIFAENLYQAPREEKAKVILTKWDALAKVRVVEFNERVRAIMTDNTASSNVLAFDGDYNNPNWKNIDFGINIESLVKRYKSCKFVSLGAGGGKDVFQALIAGAGQSYAVEVNPYINYLMTDGLLKDFSGNLYKDKRVIVVSEDARTFIKKFKNKFDFICSFSSNSYAALASGAFALAENFLYTREALLDYWDALDDDGIILLEHHFYIPRMFTAAFDGLGEKTKDISKHIAVFHIPEFRRDIMIISKKPLEPDFCSTAFGDLSDPLNHGMQAVYPSMTRNLYTDIASNHWSFAQESLLTNIAPPIDNSPFINEMGLWKNFSFKKLGKIEAHEFFGFPLSQLIIVMILIIVIIIVTPIMLIPFRQKGKKLTTNQWLYFFFIGYGFMATEVILIQKYTLFIGVGIYSLIIILFTLLLASAIGSRFSEKIDIKYIFAGIGLFLLLETFIFSGLREAIFPANMLLRLLITAIMLAPLGFFMGMPFPKMGKLVGELIDWGFAVNGAASVIGASLSVLIAINWGYDVALSSALITYILAFLCFTTKNKAQR